MDEPRGVRGAERAGRVHQRAPADQYGPLGIGEQPAHCLSDDELHREVRAAVVGLSNVVDVRDVRVRERRHRARLAEHALARMRVADGFGQQHLERDVPLEPNVSRAHDGSHSARAEHTLDPIASCDGLPRFDYPARHPPTSLRA